MTLRVEMRLFIPSWRFPLVISSKSTVFVICTWTHSMSARVDYCFNLAIVAKILLPNVASCPDAIMVALSDIWHKVFKNGPSKICGRQPLNNFTWSVLEYFVSFVVDCPSIFTASQQLCTYNEIAIISCNLYFTPIAELLVVTWILRQEDNRVKSLTQDF